MTKKKYIFIIGLLVVLLLSCENIVRGNGKQNISFSMNEQYSCMIQRSLEKNKNYTENSLLKIEYGLLRGKKTLSSVTKSVALKDLPNTVFNISEIPFGNNYFVYINIFFDDILIYSAFSDRLIVTQKNSNLNLKLPLKQHNSNVEYILNGGEFSQSQNWPNLYFINSNIVLPIPLKEGYIFDGWFIDKDFSGDKITSIGEDFFKGDIVLYAKWNEETSLYPTITEPTNKSVEVIVNITKSISEIKTVKFAKGVQTVDYFTNGGTVIAKAENNYKFSAEENGDYTVFVQYYDGIQEIKTINISNIDVKAPGVVTNLTGVYTSFNQEIKLNWTLPKDKDIKEIEILENGKAIGKIPSDQTEYVITNKATLEPGIDFTVIVYDQAGNKSTSVTAIKDVSPSFSSFNIPTVKNIKRGQSITATVTGSNFKVKGLLSEHFKLTCTEQSSVVTDSKVKIVDNTTLNVTLTVPETAGNYIVNITCGENKFDGNFKVDEVVIGDIILNDGSCVSSTSIKEEQKAKAIAVVFDINSEGKILGLGLKEKAQIQWTGQNSVGYNTSITDIICIPSIIGNGAALTATFTGDTDGSDNWSVICEIDPEGVKDATTNYPAFDWVNNYGSNLPEGSEKYADSWYMPSISELSQIYKNKEVLTKVLVDVGGMGLESYSYWSSSQDNSKVGNALTVSFGYADGFIDGYCKYYDKALRSVRAF